MSGPADLSAIFKAYDVRGVVPEEIDPDVAFAIGRGFARFVLEGSAATRVLVARDMRTSGEKLAAALSDGILAYGLDVTDLGIASTDLLYYAAGHLDAPGVMLTASHNPAQYNGMKFCLAGALPVGEESGLPLVRAFAEEALSAPAPPSINPSAKADSADLLEDFAAHVRSFVDVNALAPLKVVADTANGMGGLIAPAVFAGLPMELDVLFGDLDGTFPNHPADPIQPENLVSLVERVRSTHADVGLAFDGDADRVFLVDETGALLSGSLTTAIVAKAMLARHPGATILYNCICSKIVPETIEAYGGVGIRTRVGHSFIKTVMAETGAIFGGEHSGHYYFKENFRADSGIIAALHVLEVLSEEKVTLSALRAPFERYVDSGEINTPIADAQAAIAAVLDTYEKAGAAIDRLDGLTIDLGEWWFNLRSSNTEPLLQLNVEARDAATVEEKVREITTIIARAGGANEGRH